MEEVKKKIQEILEMCEKEGITLCVYVADTKNDKTFHATGGELKYILAGIVTLTLHVAEDSKMSLKKIRKTIDYALKTAKRER